MPADTTSSRLTLLERLRHFNWQQHGMRWLLFAILGLFATYYLTPLLVMLITSVKSLEELRQGNLLALPKDPVFSPWVKAWFSACSGIDCQGLKPFFLNSIRMVIPSVLISTSLGAINGYILSKWRFKGSEIIFALMLFGCFIPFQVVLLPMARTLGAINLAGSIYGLILVHVIYGIGFTTLFFRNYYVGIPDALVHAAKIDGAGFWNIFIRVFLPISAPIIVVSFIWQFTQIWNDFLFGVAFSAPDSRPVTVALNNIINSTTGVKEYNVEMASAMIAALPTLVVYILAGKYFIRGLTAGALKG